MNQSGVILLGIAIVALVVVLRVRYMAREQKFGIVRMWATPPVLAALTAWIMIFDRFTSASDVALAVVALAVGGAIGWYQGTHTTVRVDRAAGAMFVKTSPIGIAIFMGVLLVRVGVRLLHGVPPPGSPANGGAISLISILLLVLLVGMVTGLRAYLTRIYSVAILTGA
jgi:hypothetical protein